MPTQTAAAKPYNLATFGKRLRELRGETPRVIIAKKVGCTHEILFKWETGKNFPTLPYLTRIAAHYGVTIDYLAGATE